MNQEKLTKTKHQRKGSQSQQESEKPKKQLEPEKPSEKNKTSDKNKSSENHKSTDKNKSSENHKSTDKNKSSENHKSPDKNKSSENHKSTDKNKSSENNKSSDKNKPTEEEIPSRLQAFLKPDEISDIKNILNSKEVESTRCKDLITKVDENIKDRLKKNTFLYNLTYGIISFVEKIGKKSTKLEYIEPFKKLIKRKDVQLLIYENGNNLYTFYSIIFNKLNCSGFVDAFIKVTKNMDESIKPNKVIFWKKFYNFLNYNTRTKQPNAPKKSIPVPASPLETTYIGDQYLENASEKLLFFAYIGSKSFAKPKDYSYMYDLIFMCFIMYNDIREAKFYPVLISNDPDQAIDYLIKYINRNTSKAVKKIKSNEINLFDHNFPTNLRIILDSIVEEDYESEIDGKLLKLIISCIPLIENYKKFNSSIILLVQKLCNESKKIFLTYLLGCFNEQRSTSKVQDEYDFDHSLCLPIEAAISFLKSYHKAFLTPNVMQEFLTSLLNSINTVDLDRLKCIIELCLEIYKGQKEDLINIIRGYLENEKWSKVYQKTIRNKKKLEAGKNLDDYFNELKKQFSKLSEKTESVTVEFNNNSENNVTYNLIFIGKKKSQKDSIQSTITFDGTVTIKQAIARIANIGIYGKDKDDEELKQISNLNISNNDDDDDSNLTEEIDVDDDDDNDSIYHTMKLGRDSHFCKPGQLFGHPKTPADRSIRESAEIFGLSNYIDRSISFNSIGFPNNDLYIELVPMIKLKLNSNYITKNNKNIRLKLNQEEDPEANKDEDAEVDKVDDPEANKEKETEVNKEAVAEENTKKKHNLKSTLSNFEDYSDFDFLTSTEMHVIFKLTGHPPTIAEAKQFLSLGKDINKFIEYLVSQEKS